MKVPFHTIWTQAGSFRWLTRYGVIRGTFFAALLSAAFSCMFSLLVMAALHRVSLMGIFISTAIPLIIVPLHWYPFARISEQLAATESLLRKSEGKYRSILEKMNEAYIEVDRTGRLTFFNDSLCRITGYGRAELEQRSVADFAGRLDLRRVARSARRIAKGGTVGSLFDFPITVGDGATRYLDVSFSLLRDEENRWCGYHAVLFDVTENMVAAREKREIEDQLARAKRMESLGVLAGGVAHDLNNILCGIVGYPDLLLLDCTEEGFLKTSLLEIKKSGEKAATVVQDLLTLSRRGVVVTDVVNLNDIVADYLQSPEHAQLVKSFPDIAVAVDFGPALLNIEGGTLPLYKSVMNLVLNSFEAITPPGTVSLTTENRYLDLPLRGYDRVKPGEYVTLTVADTGSGISPEDRERIFEPFYTKKVMGRSGTGLGMAVVWGTVKDHQGYVLVESEVGKGSTVALFFPASRRELPSRETPPGVEHFFGRGESILVVDDLPDQRTLVAKMLERLGYRVHAVPSGEAAVEHLKAGAADLMILDMIMDPGLDGLDTYRLVRGLRPGLRVIITSGFSETQRVREAQRFGAGPYVRKPYRLETLAKVVHEALAAGPR
ncbi:MAG: hybrid sensor histidine kinase/response regulator [Candidatus Methylomirabilia bacterium]